MKEKFSIVNVSDTSATIEQDSEYSIDWRKYGRPPMQGASAPTDDAYNVACLVSKMERIINALEKPRLAPEDTLWTSEQNANWLGMSKQTVEVRVVTRPGFPASFRPVDSKQAQRRWFASDVIEWARSTAGTLPTAKVGRRRKPS
ncbi:hypothetical protein RI103_14435 [Paraburkholderia sp. FT54]|uniref:hypothetical protein n=1 Tax=Paraburkholderia sp. FT54 TaxID=3074437 RepID=UPI0028775EFF|nr:hypothetical protein [Paraburkholderia sp. FT54]WNC88882.1 hypothetical protein RI103_14435 [Paraburkholderia sp. FT54]